MFSRDLTVLPAHPHVHPQSEWAIPAFAFPDAAGTHFAVLFKGERLRDQPSPEMLTSKIFNTISAYLYSCRCQYCYHIKQKYCIFFPPKAFCDNQKVLKRLGELTTFPRPPVGWGGEHPSQSPPLDTFGISTMAPYFSEPPLKFFSPYGPDLQRSSNKAKLQKCM